MVCMRVLVFIPPAEYKDDALKLATLFMEKWGIAYDLSSYHTGECRGSQGHITKVRINTKDARPSDYGAFVIIGGDGIDKYKLPEFRPLIDMVIKFSNENKKICAIGSGIKIIPRANIIKGKRIVSNQNGSIAQNVSLFHGIPSDKPFEIQGNITTISDKEVSFIEQGLEGFMGQLG